MGKPTPSQGKAQQSISSFFTKKTTNSASQPSQASQASQKSPSTRKESNLYDAETDDDQDVPLITTTNGASKRVLVEDTSGGNNSMAERPSKRAKGDDESNASGFFEENAARKPSSTKSKISPRTERYLYTSSGQASTSETIPEEDSEAVKARKVELHRKFVKKLGHPDSLAQLRRRNWQSNEDTGALEDVDGEGEDAEEDTPAPTKSKKKGAKTGKLTPLEIQILDIKRKHMDTLLIIEVGYKFKFFGEDARTAAKELSIVCIPGKFRYDERKSLKSNLLYSCLMSP
jgi:DNA mismatch repair protein MSH3